MRRGERGAPLEEEDPSTLNSMRISLNSMEIRATKIEKFENFSELIELSGTFLLPEGPTKNLRILLDNGATNSFINKRLVDQCNIKRLKNQKLANVSLGDNSIIGKRGKLFP